MQCPKHGAVGGKTVQHTSAKAYNLMTP